MSRLTRALVALLLSISLVGQAGAVVKTGDVKSSIEGSGGINSGAGLPSTCEIGEVYFDTAATTGRNVYGCTSANTWTLEGDGTSAGSGTVLDLADNGVNESPGIAEIATTGDTNSIFTEPTADKLLINVGNKWPASNTADALAANGSNCSSGNAPLGVDAAGAVEGCFDVATQTELDTHTSDTAAHSAVATNTASRIVTRDASGNFAAGTITAALSGNASTSSALAANGTNCGAGEAAVGVDASGNAEGCFTPSSGSSAFNSITSGTNTTAAMVVGTGGSLAVSGSGTIAATTSAALAANGTNCSAGQASRGIDAAGNAEDCFTPSGSGDALTTQPLSQFAATTSAQLAGVISDETGTGAVVLASSPTLTTPTIGSFVNANHNHNGASSGGQLTDAALSAAVGVAKGGTGLTSGTSGGVPYFSGTTTIASSGALAANAVVRGGGAGAAPSSSTGLTLGSATVDAQADRITTANATATLGTSDGPIVACTGGASDITLTLPDGTSTTQRRWTIIKVDSGAGKCLVDGNGTETINGGTGTVEAATQWSRVDLNLSDSAATAGWSAIFGKTAPLTVADGGTGATTLTGVVVGNGTSAMTAATSSTVGQTLRVTGANTYAFGALDLADTDAVTGDLPLTNIAQIATDRLLGRDTAGTGDLEQLTVSGGLEFSGAGGIQRSALTGDVTASAGSNATTIANNAVSYAKMQDVSAASKLLGRGDSGAGDPQEITLGSGLTMTGTTVSVSAGGGNVSNTGTPADNQVAVWTGTQNIEGTATLTYNAGVLGIGEAGATLGKVTLSGNTSGTITVQPQAAAGTYNFNLPTTAGSSGNVLTSAGGGASAMTWTALAASATTDTTNASNISSGTLAAGRLPAASDTAVGGVELATASETTTGTDAARAVTPDGLAGSDFGKRYITLECVPDATALTTGDGKCYFPIHPDLNTWVVVGVSAHVGAAVSSSGAVNVDIDVCGAVATGIRCSGTNRDLLSTNITIDANEDGTETAAAAAVINTSNDDLATGEWLRFNIDAAGTGTQGLYVTAVIQKP